MNTDPRKVGVIGCGFVGASIAFRFLQQGLFSKMVLLDMNHEKAEGEAIDLSDGLPYGRAMEITAGTYDDITDCGLVVITAGANQKPGETRLDLISKNIKIMEGIIREITAREFGGILLIVSNPVDVLTYAAWKISGYPKERVIGSGTVLDTGRLKQLMGEELGVDSRNVHASGDGAWMRRTSSGCTGRCGTAPMRSSSAREPLTTASPWRWAGLPSALSRTSTLCCRCPWYWTANTD